MARENVTGKYFALKIQKSKPSYQESALDEIQILQDLQKHEMDEKWLEFINKFNDSPNQEKIYGELMIAPH